MAEDDLEEGLEEGLEDIENVEEELSPSSGKMKKIIIFIGIALFLLVGGGAGLYFTGMLDGVLNKGSNCEAILEAIENEDGDSKDLTEEIPEECLKSSEDGGEANAGEHTEPGVFLEIPNLIVNFNSTSGRPKYLKLSIQIEVETEEEMEKLEKGMPRIVDHFQTYLRELRLEDMRGSSGIYRMRIELKSRISSAIPGVEIRDVLFQEILIQQ